LAKLSDVRLDDKYARTSGRVYLSGVQALVRLPIIQQLRDQAAGLATAGFISGYRGSPLGGLDIALTKAQRHLVAHNIKFQPGVNEELAATSVWGSQQVGLIGPARYDGVFALWYGKGPGVDRCGDVFKHMNFAGTAKYGGVLLVAGDDHGAYSSTLPHQSDHLFAASMIPVLYPCNVQEYIELGLHGWAMSRFSGCAVGLKALADTVESSTSIEADPFATKIVTPTDFAMPEGGLNAVLSTAMVGVQARQQEALMQDYKIYAALAYARANRLNRTVIDSENARLGIVASGKSYLDVLEALSELGIDESMAQQIGIRLFKISMPWPLEPDSIREFARGLDEILVVEEKRQVVEYQLKEHLYNWREDTRPRVIGKFDEQGEWVAPRGAWLLTSKADFSIAQIARVIAGRISRFYTSNLIRSRLEFLTAKEQVLAEAASVPPRTPYYCSGCPHNTSTKVPEGSFALAGIGCHVMATAIYPEHTKTTTQMGGEGSPWIGQSPFSKAEHVFANLGDGTYFHSGILAIRATIAAGVNITYKILYNDAVAMTGGQPIDGPISVAMIARQLDGEGVKRIAIVSEDLQRLGGHDEFPRHVTFHDRAELDFVQKELRAVPGTSVLIYDQTCAAEKRRRRKSKRYPDPDKRLLINQAVCEGCGDCGVQSNCTSLVPVETEFGRKRAIDQSSCNKDYSCVKGFCPSFVTVEGGTLRNRQSAEPMDTSQFAELPEPALPDLQRPFNILITGIGGTGVITIGALLGMAAHLEEKGVTVLDMTGMSQKNGAVTSHVRLSANPKVLYASRIASGEADLIIGCDMLTAGSSDALAKMQAGRSFALINDHITMPGQFAQHADWQFPADQVRTLIRKSVDDSVNFIDASFAATALLGDSIATNLFMVGYAWQCGRIPLSEAALMRAIELNDVSVAMNKAAFLWGRRMATDQGAVLKLVAGATAAFEPEQDLQAIIDYRYRHLIDYQNVAYAERYRLLMQQVIAAEHRINSSAQSMPFATAIARALHKLMAYKDEYEIARLFTNGEFRKTLAEQFEGDIKLSFNMAPPLLSKKDPQTGFPIKRRFPGWVFPLFQILARLKGLRGTRFDIFGYTAERRMERELMQEFMRQLDSILGALNRDNCAAAIEWATLVEHVRGFGHIKLANVERYRAAASIALKRFRGEILPVVVIDAAA
jgi:indolepyruvate ferredoxin oxidoreductase